MKKTMLTNSNKPGFTLVELILAMGILTLLMTVLMKVFLDIIEMRLEAEAESAVSQDARYLYSRLLYDLSRAQTVGQPSSPGGSSSSLQLVIDGVTYTYARDAENNLTMDDGTGAVRLNSAGSKVTGATFVRRGGAEGAQSITATLDVESNIQRVQGPVLREVKVTGGTR